MTDLPAPAPTRPLYTGGILHRLTHPAEVAGALDAARTAGKIGAIGVSNHAPAELDALQAFLPVPAVSTQPEFSPLAIAPLTNGVLDEAMARRMTVLAWSPLGGGDLRAGRRQGAHRRSGAGSGRLVRRCVPRCGGL